MTTIRRSLSRDDKHTQWTLDGTTLTTEVTGKAPKVEDLPAQGFRGYLNPVKALLKRTRTRLKQGWAPTEPQTFVDDLLAAKVPTYLFVPALTDAEVDAFYTRAIAENLRLDLDIFRARPTRGLLEHLLQTLDPDPDFSKALKVVTKDDAVLAWTTQTLKDALAGSPSRDLEKFLTRNLKNFEKRRAPVVLPTPPADTERDLLEKIAADPENDAPRLIYADWLMEHGIGWGEVVPVSCERDRLDFGPERTALDKRFDKLVKKHQKAWMAPIREFVTGWSIHRGLIRYVETQPKRFLHAPEAVALRCPRGTLTLTGVKAKHVAELANCPLGRFADVRLSQQRLTDAHMELLAASPKLAGVENWDLGHNKFGDRGIHAIASSPHFRATRHLDVSATFVDPQITSEALTALLASDGLPALEWLEVSVTTVGEAFRTCRLPLKTLTLDTAEAVTAGLLEKVLGSTALTQLSVRSRQQTEPVSEAELMGLVERHPQVTHLQLPWPLPDPVLEVLRGRL